MSGPLGTFALPVDVPSSCALAAGIALFLASRFPAPRRLWEKTNETGVVLVLALLAAALSAGYVVHYLRGGARIIDATSYFLQARALSEGHLAFDVAEPSGSFRGRFLVHDSSGEPLSVIFPPGYPAALAVGFWLGAPLAVGPAIAAAIVIATHALALRLFNDRRTALLAASFSVVSAALRYHTADTMSHGLCALLFLLAVLLVLDSRRVAALGSGVALGWLLATRPVTGAVAVGVALGAAGGLRRLWILPGLLPGLALLLGHQYAATGDLFGSPQLAYYALADGPPGCFRLGFGSGVGCLVEHGDFVRARLADGYGPIEALGTTLRRLKGHLLDVANFEPWSIVVAIAAARGTRSRAVRLIALPVVGVVAAYAPFYFDGNYPGGGARMFADVLPFEHVLLAWALERWSIARFGVPAALIGFSVHASHEHHHLANREGGRPMFEPEVLRASGVDRGLVFVETDHGFSLGFDPDANAASGVVVARRRGDDHDAWLQRALGDPPTFAYRYSLVSGAPHVEPLGVLPIEGRFEAEAEWPPLEVRGGWVRFDYAACASGGRALTVVPVGSEAEVKIEVGVMRPGAYRVTAGWLHPGGEWSARITLGDAAWTAGARESGASSAGTCALTPLGRVTLAAGWHRLGLIAAGRPVALDVLHLERDVSSRP